MNIFQKTDKTPVLSDNVSGYERDMQVKNGYSKMIDD